MAETARVLGVDACKAGWVGVTLERGAFAGAHVATTIRELVDLVGAGGPVAVVAVDIPIGLPERGPRRADELVRQAIGPRRSSLFMTPVRTALETEDYATAVRVNRDATGKGFSKQAYGLRAKLFQVERFVDARSHTVIEVHPELSFMHLNDGAVLEHGKVTWAGAALRRGLLSDAGVTLPGDLGRAGSNAAVDDVLDAAAAAWTGTRYAAGQAVGYPDEPEPVSRGRTAAIWA